MCAVGWFLLPGRWQLRKLEVDNLEVGPEGPRRKALEEEGEDYERFMQQVKLLSVLRASQRALPAAGDWVDVDVWERPTQ